jgi:hypothetical protein
MTSTPRLTDEGAEARGQVQEGPGIVENGSRAWASQFWANTQQVALRFASAEELDAAIDWLWVTPEMRELPRVHVGENTMVVPAGAVEAFRQRGFKFDATTVVSAGALPAEEVNRIRREG